MYNMLVIKYENLYLLGYHVALDYSRALALENHSSNMIAEKV